MQTHDVSDSAMAVEQSNNFEGKNESDSKLTLKELIKKINATENLEELEALASKLTKEELEQLGKELIKLGKDIKSVIKYNKDGRLKLTYEIESLDPYQWSLKAFVENQGSDFNWVPIALLDFEISLRKLELVFHRKKTTENKDNLRRSSNLGVLISI